MALHPLAQYPLEGLNGIPSCSFPPHDPAYLTALMLEASLMQCACYVSGTVLDVGCGRRPYEKTYFSKAVRYIGADYLSDRSSPDVIASALALPLKNSAVETVISTELLEHVPDPRAALSEMRRVLKPGGYMILSTPMYWPRHEIPYDFFRYPYDGLLHLLQTSGFEVVKLFNRGRSYAFLGQVIQHVAPRFIQNRIFSRWLNRFFLRCDRRRNNDTLTLGWTIVGR